MSESCLFHKEKMNKNMKRLDSVYLNLKYEIKEKYGVLVSHLRNVDLNCFESFTSLRQLDLKVNAWKCGLFRPLTNLLKLNLNYSNLGIIQNGLFDGLNNLEKLEISSCSLRQIEDCSFSCLINVVKIN